MGLISKHVSQSIKILPEEEINRPVFMDPRPDLTDDHHIWNVLLRNAYESHPEDSKKSEEFCGVLNGLRCGGTRLRFGKNGWELKPDIDVSGKVAWSNHADYNEMKEQYLVPWSDWVIRALNELK
jgi:hypothetical protein